MTERAQRLRLDLQDALARDREVPQRSICADCCSLRLGARRAIRERVAGIECRVAVDDRVNTSHRPTCPILIQRLRFTMATDSQRAVFVRLVRAALEVAASIAIIVGASATVHLAAFPQARSRADPTVGQILAAGAKYVEEYEKQFSAVISEERYEQSWTPLGSRIVQRRLLRSDLIVMNAGKAGWISFRDVFEVDGAPGSRSRQSTHQARHRPHG